jgi:hypothetical protein
MMILEAQRKPAKPALVDSVNRVRSEPRPPPVQAVLAMHMAKPASRFTTL